MNSQNIKTESLAQFEHCKIWIRRRQKINSKPRKSFPENEIQDQEEQFAVLDADIEYKLKGFYPEGLTVDQKCSARRKAKSIAVEHGEVSF